MRLDLAERMRCPGAHEATPLIVVAKRVVDRELIEGVAGCPACYLEARVTGGVVHFDAPVAITVASDGADGTHAGESGDGDDPAVERTAALLGLAEPGGVVLLTGRYAAYARALHARFDVAAVVVESPGAVPFTDQTFRAAALDPGAGVTAVAADAIRTVSVGGHILLPASCALPPGVRLLAEDDREKVAAREAPAIVVPLSRASPPRTTSR